ncbi:MAG: hypothetical protein IPH24_05045 [Crocinitomicaceae bacterium]|nr:hypothetical protein [Crocinitomicaceae bacterium]
MNLIILLSLQNAVWGFNALDSTRSEFVFVAVTPSETEATVNWSLSHATYSALDSGAYSISIRYALKQKLRS